MIAAASSCWGIVPAAGRGLRMGSDLPKQYLLLGRRTVLDHSIAALLAHAAVRAVVVAVAPGDERWRGSQHAGDPRVRWVEGGAERCHSVLNALDTLSVDAGAGDWVLVHDAARPCLRAADVGRLIAGLAGHPVGGVLGSPARDTMKRCGADGTVTGTVERQGLWHAYTPQMFRYAPLRAALRDAIGAGLLLTDESAAVERAGLAPRLVEGSSHNIKVTRPEDLPLAEFLLGQTARGPTMRIGHGYDAHRFGADRPLVLGGVTVPHGTGLVAHSDGDVLIHALCDALLGAAGLGDIGRHFPDSDPAYAAIDSRILLRRVVATLHERGLGVQNVDATVVAQRPRLADHIAAMRETLAGDLAVPVERVNVKATTTEGMGFTGRAEGIAAHAVALLDG